MLVPGMQRVQEYPPDAGGAEIEMERWKSLYLSVSASGEGGQGQTESSGPGMAKDSRGIVPPCPWLERLLSLALIFGS